MKAGLARLLGVSSDLLRPTLQLSLCAFFVIAAQTTTKAVRDGVFLNRFGLVGLSYAMLAMAVIMAFVASSYHRWTGIVGRRRAFIGLMVGSALSLVAIGQGLHAHIRGMAVILYAWSSIVALVALAELWLCADDRFTAIDAKRAFAVIGSGAILGGVLGGVSTRLLATSMSPRKLLWIVAVELVIAALSMPRVARDPIVATSVAEQPRFSDTFRAVARSKYVRTLAVMMMCLTIVATTIEWQTKGLAKAHFASNERELVAFFGIVGAAVSVVSLAVQLFGTRRLLRAFGVIPSLHGLPIVAGMLSVTVLGAIALPLGALALLTVESIATDGLRLSLDKSATEMLYLPLEPQLRAAAKRFVDTVVDRMGGAITAGIWLALVALFHIDWPDRLPWASVLVIVAVMVWLFALRAMRRQYVDAHRQLIGVPDGPPAQASRRVRRTVTNLWRGLDKESRIRTRVLRRLNALQHGAPLELDWEQIAPHVEREALFAEQLARVFASDLGVLGPSGEALERLVEERLARSLERVARLLALVYPPRDLAALHRALHGPSERIRAAAIELLDSMVIGPSRTRLLRLVAERFGAATYKHEPMTADEALALLAASDDLRLRDGATAALGSRAQLQQLA